MQPKDRYDASDFDESHYEPGFHRRVLKNLLGITGKREMDQLEGREQVRALEALADFFSILLSVLNGMGFLHSKKQPTVSVGSAVRGAIPVGPSSWR